MFFLLKLAARNLLRNTRRSGISLAMVALGLGLIVVTINFQGGSYDNILGAAISSTAGHVVVQAPGWRDDPDPERVLEDSHAVAATVREALPDAIVTHRAFLGGLLTSPTGSVAVSLTGVAPEAEAQASTLDEHLVQGEWLSGEEGEVELGVKLAEQLGVGLGDKLVFMGQVGEADMVSVLLRVKGIFHTGSPELDAFTITTSLADAQKVLPGTDPATQVAVHLDSASGTDRALATVQAALPGIDADILDWEHAIPVLREQMAMDEAMSDVIYTMMGCIVAVGLVNTVLMGVMERMREFGVLLAVGMRPRRLARLVMLEGAVLGVVGALLGLGLGVLGTWPLAVWGIDYGEMMNNTMNVGGAIEPIIYAGWDVERMFAYAAGAAVLTLLATLYPAYKVTRLSPVQAIRHQ